MAELDPVIGQHGMDLIGHGLDQSAEEVRGGMSISFRFQPGESKLRGAVDRDEQVELTLFCPDLGDGDVEVADGVVRETLRLRDGAESGIRRSRL